ncbi:MAG: response regulator [Candidatus Omnitrophica bacterium]|nr:response regulator [Candidatus Omnitrophota bacterium]
MRKDIKLIKVVVGIGNYEHAEEIVDMLKTMYTVEVVADAEEAYHTIHVFKPNLAILDFSLAKIHPIELYEGVALIHPEVSFVLCVTKDNFKVAQRVWNKRSADFIFKPFTPQQFIYSVNKVVRNIINIRDIEQLKRKIEFLQAELQALQQQAGRTEG